MAKPNWLKAWVLAARLRTLPLSLSGIIGGNALAWQAGIFQSHIFWGAVVTASIFQILSNFANDYGDGVKGTDNENRLGPARALQSGLLTAQALKTAMWVLSLLGVLSSIFLIGAAFNPDQYGLVLLFLGLAVLAVVAAIKYTVGQNAYGYRGLGDLFVFIFFGGVSVLGSYFLQVQQLSWNAVLFSVVFGTLSVGVLNLNNMRDFENDRQSGKNTLVVQWGLSTAFKYQISLLLIACVCFTAVIIRSQPLSYAQLAYLLPLLILLRIPKRKPFPTPEKLDAQLKPLALTAFFSAVFYWIFLIIGHGS